MGDEIRSHPANHFPPKILELNRAGSSRSSRGIRLWRHWSRSQNNPGEPPARARTAIRRISFALPTSMKWGSCSMAAELVMDGSLRLVLFERAGPIRQRNTQGATAACMATAQRLCALVRTIEKERRCRRGQNASHLMLFLSLRRQLACPRSFNPSNCNLRSQLWRSTHSPSQQSSARCY